MNRRKITTYFDKNKIKKLPRP